MKKALLLIWTYLLFATVPGFAQTLSVKGIITGNNNEPLSGADIIIKGTKTGTTTNSNGEFGLATPGNATLVISHIGYTTKEISVSGRSFVQEVLETQNQQMSEVVVIGYQTTSRKNVTTSIASISGKEIETYATGTPATALQGKLAGVQIMANDGTPGSQPRILVRGFSSLTQNNNPLVIVDGMEIAYNNMNTINPSDIETFDVLKDASAASIYGARAGQGVILITTKRGKGKPVINVDAMAGIAQAPEVNLSGAEEYARVMNQIATNSTKPLPFASTTGLTSNDYWKQTFGNGTKQDYNVSIRGGKDGLSLFGSVGYYKDVSYAGVRGGEWDKFTARLNADMKVNDWAKLGLSFAPRYEKYPYAPLNVTWNAMAMDPTVAPFRTEQDVLSSLPTLTGTYADFMTAFNSYYSLPNFSAFSSQINPEFNLRTNFDKREYWGSEYNAHLDLTPLKGLLIKASLDGRATSSQRNDYIPKYFFTTKSAGTKSQTSSSTSVDSRYKFTLTANYATRIKDHDIDVLAGMSFDDYAAKSTSATRDNIPLDAEAYQYTGAASLVTGGSGSYQPGAGSFGRMLSYFGSLRYKFKDRYFLTGTMRADASSLVNPLYRWGYFPSVSGAWMLSEEKFFESLTRYIDYLKLRASWGKSGGNLPGSVGSYLTTVNTVLGTDANGNPIVGYAPSNIANPRAMWEVQQDYTVGLDAAFFKNKLSLTVERYVRNPNNLMLPVNVDYVLGYPQGYLPVQYTNIGKLTTKGWDVNIGYKDAISKKLRYNVTLTVSQFITMVNDLSTADPIIGQENNDGITTGRSRITVGHQPGVWWGYIVDGVFQSDEEAASYTNKDGNRLQPKATAGDLKYRDVNNDGQITIGDLTDLGSPYPKFTTGLNITLSYSNFDFRSDFYGAFGQKIFNNYRRNMLPTGHYNFLAGFADQFWHGEGTSNSFPILREQDLNNNFNNMSTFFLEKGDFVKCNLMQLGYTFSPKQLKGITRLRLYVSAQNLFTISSYSGINPDVPWYNSTGYNGVDNYQMINPRTYLVGINLTL
jgi:TonB-linked SusC/RagA family outer membrane protein